MKISKLFLTLLFSFNIWAEKANIPIELHFEPVDGAKSYQIEVSNTKGEVLKTVDSPKPGFKFKMKSGQYKVRSRVIDKNQTWSDWSDYAEFNAAPPPPEMKIKPVVQAKKEKGEIKGKVDFEWTPILNADSYKMKIKDTDGKTIKKEVTKKSKLALDLPPGTYNYELTSISKDGWESSPLKSEEPITISDKPSKEPQIEQNPEKPNEIKIAVDEQAEVHIEIEYCPHLSENWKKTVTGFTIKNHILTFDKDARPGKYKYTLWTSRPGWVDSEKITNELVLKPTEPQLFLN